MAKLWWSSEEGSAEFWIRGDDWPERPDRPPRGAELRYWYCGHDVKSPASTGAPVRGAFPVSAGSGPALRAPGDLYGELPYIAFTGCAFCSRMASHVVVDMPEPMHTLMFGDAPTRRNVCIRHRDEMGPWDFVERLP